MTWEQYGQQMNRLAGAYAGGEKVYGEERGKIFWGIVKDLSLEEFSGMISYLIGNHLRPPLAQEFYAAKASVRERNYAEEKKNQRNEPWERVASIKPRCDVCQDTNSYVGYNYDGFFCTYKCEHTGQAVWDKSKERKGLKFTT